MNDQELKNVAILFIIMTLICVFALIGQFANNDNGIIEETNDMPATTPETSQESEMRASQEVIKQIAIYEGFSEKAVWDVNHYSIGFGSTADSPDDTITYSEATQRLLDDIYLMESSVNSFALVNGLTFTQNQFDALVSFCYNLGFKALDKYNDSDLINMIKSGVYNDKDFTDAWCAFCKAGGVELPQLKERRLWEANLYLKK